ncbi:hypothetical protein AB0H42_35710, partial [Nocardia sp. NPDC050799]|uniref:hypothetical protein n=1 Tax=Nocardia sp. NPDC050799 TaxID=3154842 RepID=UPI00340486DB
MPEAGETALARRISDPPKRDTGGAPAASVNLFVPHSHQQPRSCPGTGLRCTVGDGKMDRNIPA